MGFKADTSFLRFLSMGAAGVRRVMSLLRDQGFEPIELERYCASNKIWATKVKRLRLPDIMCVRTGLRAEVRAKSDLKIRMSDAPGNPARTWDASARDDDLVAFIASTDGEHGPVAADRATFFTVRSLRQSVGASKLGEPKSAGEGAERDRTWPATVPSRDGRVLEVSPERIVVEMEGEDGARRRQPYRLAGKHAYVNVGESVRAGASIIAGAPAALADLRAYRAREYDPLPHLASRDIVDRYAAVKALPKRRDKQAAAMAHLERLVREEEDERVRLEAAATAATLGAAIGQEHIGAVITGGGRVDLKMEAVFILTELGGDYARRELVRIATDRNLGGTEFRQAAVWGLGKAGLKLYAELVPLIDDGDNDVALHAVAAFGSETPQLVIDALIARLRAGEPRASAAASESLRLIGSQTVLESLVRELGRPGAGKPWLLATIGRLDPAAVEARVRGTVLADDLAPLLMLSRGRNWIVSEPVAGDLHFLLKQDL